jgi:hypothetical protein
MILYVLTMILFTKDGPAPITKMYDSAFNCQVAEALILTVARDDKTVIGWSIPVECVAVPETNKI